MSRAGTFAGFSEGPVHWVPLPAPLFQQVVPHITDLNELRAVLYVFWRFAFHEGPVHYLTDADAAEDDAYWGALGATPEARRPAVRAALDAAVARGVLLAVDATDGSGRRYYFLNSPKGRAAVQAWREGRWHPETRPSPPPEALAQPNVFRIYEENFGPLTPLIADRLRAALAQYPVSWIVEAMALAVERNVRRWRYVEAILERWTTEGRDDRIVERHPEADAAKYKRDPYARFYE